MTRQGSPTGAVPSRPRAGLDALFEPHSVAVVGASDDPAKWGHILARRALASQARRPVALVNRRGGPVLGRPTHRDVVGARAAWGHPVDLVVVCVPASAVVGAVHDAVAGGARAIVVITAGLAELGAEGAAAQAEAVAAARAGGALLVGPNCLGVADTGADLQLGHALLPPGPVSVFSQSGNLVLDLAALLAERGLGVARFVSVGNQADVTTVELMRGCLDHPGTRAVAVYAEDVVDGRGFVSAARALAEAGKPVVLLSPGRSAAASRSAVSHTGSMTSPSQVVDAACVEGAIRRVENPTQMADLLEGLLGHRRLAGRRVAVLTDGGGHGAMATDALETSGLETPVLAQTTQDRLRPVLWASSTVSNPVDLAGAGDGDPFSYSRAVTALLAADDVDGVLVTGFFGGYSTVADSLGAAELAAGHEIAGVVGVQPKPVVVHTIYPASPTSQVLRAAGIPVHRDLDRACAVMAGLVALRDAPLVPHGAPQGPGARVPEVRAPRVPEVRAPRVPEVRAPRVPEVRAPASLEGPVTDTSYPGARDLFASAGIAFPPGRIVTTREELTAAFDVTGFPLVLKALGQVHKSDAGGVVLGLRDAAAAEASYDDLVGRLAPPAVSVEAMADTGEGVELIAGCVQDRTFGPVLMVGLGGIHAEVLADTACALAPVGPERARELLLSLRGAALLRGVRGRPAVDLDALAETVSALSQVAADHPELVELEVNPLLASPQGTIALDARVVAARSV